VKDQVTVFTRPDPAVQTRADSRFARLDTAARRRAYRSLSQVAFVYSAVYTVAFFYYWWVGVRYLGHFAFPPLFSLVLTVGSVGYGLFVGLTARKDCAPASFSLIARIFLVVAAVGIAANYWRWDLVHAERLPEHVGVPWVGVWVLTFPTIVTLSPRRLVLPLLLGVASVPAVILASVAVHGVPEGFSGGILDFAGDFAFQMTFPTLMCAGIGLYSAARVFRMAEDASEARRLGSYQLAEKIGTGGMGEVWKAQHRMLARPAAIKLIRAASLAREGDTRTLLARFEREAQATALLTSPHTIQLYDFGTTDDGTFYYVMELLEGMDLRTLVERFGPVPAPRAVRFLRQACHSLADAHEHGLVHRDVKPANVFTCRRGLEYDYVKVLDFGLVKETGERADARTQLTLEGIASGTPAFMAPEMAAGEREVDGRADLYALGCVAYWLLTGDLVFPASTPMAMLVQHAKEPPAPPSARTELEIPPALDRLVLDCLAKSPDERPRSARELMRRLRELERETGEWTQERAEHWWRAHVPGLVARPGGSPESAPVVGAS